MVADGPVSSIHSVEELLKLVALACTVASAAIILWYLVRRPPLGRVTKVLLLLGLGLLPVMVALTGNIAGYEFTLSRQFCGSCHVMGPYVRDAGDPKSQSLAAIHSRNHKFGEQSCYTCHADYDMFGAITTKLTGQAPLPLRQRIRRDGARRRGRTHHQALQAPGPREGEGDAGGLQREDERRLRPVPLHLRSYLGREARRLRRRRPLERPDLHRLPQRDPPDGARPPARGPGGGGEEVRHEQVKKLVFISGVATLAALALMACSILWPSPLLLVVAMSVGQGLGTLSLALYLLAIVLDLQGGSGSLDAAAEDRIESAGEAKSSTP